MSQTHWDAAQYLKFERERTQPAQDLAARLPGNPSRILDVGCGPGNSTQVLLEHFPTAEIFGVDNSPDMIQAARQRLPQCRFALCDAADGFSGLEEGGFDVVFSNACVQWVPDHPHLLPRMMQLLAPGGVLAIQVPMNQKEPIHQIISSLVSSPAWRERIPSPRIFYTLEQSAYFDLLAGLTDDFTLWETVYLHRMPSHEAILEWYRGTGLRPYLQVLPQDQASRLEQEVLSQLRIRYPVQQNGEIMFRFPRFFMLARAKA